jgi:putative spermidine/putrescine transport system substrate-binding protein
MRRLFSTRLFSTMTMFALLAFLAIPLALAGCGSSSPSGSTNTTTLTLYASGDVNVKNLWQNTLIPEFKKAHQDIDIKLVFSEHGTNDTATFARMSAAVSAGKDAGMDLIDSGVISQAAQAKLLVPLTTKEVPLLSRVDASLIQQVSSMAIPYRASSVVLAYNSQEVKQPPTTLSDVLAWIKANPGKFTYNSPDTGGSGSAFVQAVITSQIPEDARKNFISGATYNPSLESLWKPGLDNLKSLKPSIYRNGFYPNGNTAVLQLLANSSISMAPVWSDQALTSLSQHQLPDSIKLTQLNPPFMGGPAFIGIPRTSSHIAQAETFLNWLLGSDIQAKIIASMHGYPGVQWSYVPPQVQQQYASIAHAYATGFASKFSADMNKQWQTQVAGG